MSGRMLAKGRSFSVPHFCWPPGVSSAHLVGREKMPVQFEGDLWECDCGQAWQCWAFSWRPISQRKVRKILKKAT